MQIIRRISNHADPFLLSKESLLHNQMMFAMIGNEQPEFWEAAFNEKQEMWGSAPAQSAIITKDLFVKERVKTLLVPGFGYGRNAKVFADEGMDVTGIEISKTAIELAVKRYGSSMKVYHGSVAEMPFDERLYDGIFCYALIHLLDESARIKLISDCYRQLDKDGLMVFTMISKASPTYGQGTLISKDRYAMFGGVELFFYDEESIQKEFGMFGMVEVSVVEENYPFYVVTCRKGAAVKI